MMNLKVFGIFGLILFSLIGYVFAENITVNGTVNNSTVYETIFENTTISGTVINKTILDNVTINETSDNSTVNDDSKENETSTAVIISQMSDTEKYLDYLSEKLENHKLWIILGLIAFAGYLACRVLF